MKNTRQKQIITDVIMSSFDHPNADVVVSRAKAKLSSINTATVYRILGELSKEGKILKIETSLGSHYDKTNYPHAHFKCTCCEKVFDVSTIDLTRDYKTVENSLNCQINSINVLYGGICEDCLKKNKA